MSDGNDTSGDLAYSMRYYEKGSLLKHFSSSKSKTFKVSSFFSETMVDKRRVSNQL